MDHNLDSSLISLEKLTTCSDCEQNTPSGSIVAYKEQRAIKYQKNRLDPSFLAKEALKKKQWALKNHKREADRVRQWKKENGLAYYRKNKEAITSKKLKYHKEREATDPLYKLTIKLRKAIGKAVRSGGFTKKSRSIDLLGVDYQSAFNALTDNGRLLIGELQIDHVVPCAQAQNEEELLKLQHISNLRLISAAENNLKNDKWTPEGATLCIKLLGRNWLKT